MFALYFLNIVMDRSFRKGEQMFGYDNKGNCKNCDSSAPAPAPIEMSGTSGVGSVGSSTSEMNANATDSSVKSQPKPQPKPEPKTILNPKPVSKSVTEPQSLFMSMESDFNSECISDTLQSVYNKTTVKKTVGEYSNEVDYHNVLPYNNSSSAVGGCVFSNPNV